MESDGGTRSLSRTTKRCSWSLSRSNQKTGAALYHDKKLKNLHAKAIKRAFEIDQMLKGKDINKKKRAALVEEKKYPKSLNGNGAGADINQLMEPDEQMLLQWPDTSDCLKL